MGYENAYVNVTAGQAFVINQHMHVPVSPDVSEYGLRLHKK